MLKIKLGRGHLFSKNIGLMLLMMVASFSASAAEQLSPTRQTALFAGGCFWGVDAVFKHVKGVSEVVSGYAGGSAATANYDKVSNGKKATGSTIEFVDDTRWREA